MAERPLIAQQNTVHNIEQNLKGKKLRTPKGMHHFVTRVINFGDHKDLQFCNNIRVYTYYTLIHKISLQQIKERGKNVELQLFI